MKVLPLLLLGLTALGGCSTNAPKRAAPAAQTRFLTVIPLQFAAAVEVADSLNKLRPAARLVADERTNSLIVSYESQAELHELTECIARLDIQVGVAK